MSLTLFASVAPLAGALWAVLLLRRGRLALAGALVGATLGGTGALAAGSAALAGIAELPARLTIDVGARIGRLEWRLDALSAWLLLPVGLLTIGASIHSWGYLSAPSRSTRASAYGALFCVLVSALVTVVTAGDAVMFLVAWEGMSLSAFFLVAHEDRDPEATRGAWFYLVASHLGTALFIVPLLVVLSCRAGGTSFPALAEAARSLSPTEAGMLFLAALIGFGTKAGLSPFHVWLPVAHPVAPSPVSAMMSGLVIKTGLYGILRLLSWRPDLPMWCGWVLFLAAAATGVYGILSALGQQQLKRLLAFSSIENVGIAGLGIAVGMIGRASGQPVVEALGLAGALLHVLNHALFKGLLFLSAGTLIHETGTGDMARLGGAARRMPWNAGMFAVGAAAICALPPLNGFVGEWLIYRSMMEAAQGPVGRTAIAGVVGAVMLAVVGGLALAVFARAFGLVFLGESRAPRPSSHAPTHWSMHAGMALLAAGCVGVGLAPAAAARALQLPVALLAGGGRSALYAAASPLQAAAAAALALIGVAALLLLVRARSGRTAGPAPIVATWGCGYAAPTSRMQYSGTSFAWTMLRGFRAAVSSARSSERPHGHFPDPVQLTTRMPDVAEQKLWGPLLRGFAKLARRFLPLQHGRIQLYLLYLVATVALLFAIEAWRSPRQVREASTSRPAGGERRP